MTHTKDEALQMCLEYIETDAHERKYVRHAIKQALTAQPAPVQEPVAWLNGIKRYEPEIFREDRIRMELDQSGEWVKYADVELLIATPPAAQPAVPDALTSADIQEHIEYVAGWNDCRAEMLKGMK